MATLPSCHCHRTLITAHPFYSNSYPTFGRNKHAFAPANYPKRLLVVAAQQPSFLKNFNLRFNKKSEEEDAGTKYVAADPKPIEKGSIMLSNRSSPLWFGKSRQQDPRTVFIAGATGQFGARISQRLLRDGFTVRAGITDLEFAQDVAEFATLYKIITKEDAKRLNAVQFDFNDVDSIAKAIGNATKAVITVGPTEDGPASEVTTKDAFCVVEAAKLANVKHVVVVYESEGESANILDGISSFFNNLFGKAEISLTQLIDKIVETDLSYTILKASSIDEFASSNDNNLVLKAQGKPEGKTDINDKVSKTQVASVVAEVFANTSISENKTIEVATSPSAPLKPVGELLSALPTDGRKEAFAEAQAKAKAEEEARIAAENARKAKELSIQLEEEAKRLAEQETKATELAAQVKSENGTTLIDYFASKAKDFGIDLFGTKSGTQVITSSKSQPQKNLRTLIATVKGGVNPSNFQPQQTIDTQAATVKGGENSEALQQNKDPPKVSQPLEINKILGGWFKQETIYVDDE